MTRDYVRSSQPAKRKPAAKAPAGRGKSSNTSAPFPVVRAVLALALVIGFGIFLYQIHGSSGETAPVATTREQAKKLAKAKKCDDLDALAAAAGRVFPDAGTAAREIECKGARSHKPGGTVAATTPGLGSGAGTGSGSTQPETKPADTPAKVPGDIDGDGIPDVR